MGTDVWETIEPLPQQIAAVTRRVSSTSRPQKTSAPAFIPYNATPPIPAMMAPAVDKTTEYNNVDLVLQTPESNASSTGPRARRSEKNIDARLSVRCI